MYRFGTQYMLITLSYFIVIPAAAYLYMPVFYQLELTSTYEVSSGPFYLYFHQFIDRTA
ncbi:sodium-coupled monocarboxylate transporter 1-like [Tropilaelaps mercedesae]|uniref:Sodium-coupled monocarboxylate transporter 1-like n=1 Tax=Tropilaelaps mercedesae TaxID=418985 RepID=A0A1V9XTL8_9ACAR|nr:sodium-coupled monocarboxylate transporter 1-like [Tropilaelaps mercedesae]